MSSIQLNNFKLAINNNILIQNLSFTLSEGQIVGFYAPTGSGKTTLLNIIAGIADPSKYYTEGDLICNFSRFSYVFQDSTLLENLSVLKNVMLPVEKIYGKEEAENKALSMLHMVELDHKSMQKAKKLSGGEKQRTSIARALIYPGELILMDEPFHAQDEIKKNKLLELTKEIVQNEHRMAIVVSHDKKDLETLGASIYSW